MSKCWLLITNETNWSDIKSNEIFGFNQRNKKNIGLLSRGDILVFYIIPKKLGGIFKIKSLSVKYPIRFSYGTYPNQIKIEKTLVLSKPIEVGDKWDDYKVVERLELFKNKKRWGTALMGKTILPLSHRDYKYVQSILKKVEKEEQKKIIE